MCVTCHPLRRVLHLCCSMEEVNNCIIYFYSLRHSLLRFRASVYLDIFLLLSSIGEHDLGSVDFGLWALWQGGAVLTCRSEEEHEDTQKTKLSFSVS